MWLFGKLGFFEIVASVHTNLRAAHFRLRRILHGAAAAARARNIEFAVANFVTAAANFLHPPRACSSSHPPHRNRRS